MAFGASVIKFYSYFRRDLDDILFYGQHETFGLEFEIKY